MLMREDLTAVIDRTKTFLQRQKQKQKSYDL